MLIWRWEWENVDAWGKRRGFGSEVDHDGQYQST